MIAYGSTSFFGDNEINTSQPVSVIDHYCKTTKTYAFIWQKFVDVINTEAHIFQLFLH